MVDHTDKIDHGLEDGLEEARIAALGGRLPYQPGLKPMREIHIVLHPPEGYVPSEQAENVLNNARRSLNLFLEKNQGYGSTAYNLGAKGQYADMNRKMGKLKHTLWDGHEAVGEDMVEMLMDMVGHCLLTIDFIEQEEK